MSKYSELAQALNDSRTPREWRAATALRELESENKLYEDALANYEQRCKGLEAERNDLDAARMIVGMRADNAEAERDRLRGLLKDAEAVLDPDTDMALVMEIRAALDEG